MTKLLMLMLSASLFSFSDIAYSQSSYTGKFSLTFGESQQNSNKEKVTGIDAKYWFDKDMSVADKKVVMSLPEVKLEKPVNYIEISDFSPGISGFDPFNSILIKSDATNEKTIKEQCQATYEVGKKGDPKYKDTLSLMPLELKRPNSTLNNLSTEKHKGDNQLALKLNSGDFKTAKGVFAIVVEPYFIKSVKIQCKSPIITGIKPGFVKFTSSSVTNAPTKGTKSIEQEFGTK